MQTLVSITGDEEHIQAFNYASLAINNSFFLDNLVSDTFVSIAIDLIEIIFLL